jgi:hypothetical protein
MKYKKIFIQKEFFALLGNKRRNLIVASSLLTICIFTVSLSIGAFNELRMRMDNPFTNWVTMPVLYEYRDNIPKLRTYFGNEENLAEFNLKNVSGFVKWTTKFLDPKTLKIKESIGRSLNFDDDIAKKIFEKSNVVALKDDFDIKSKDIRFQIFVSEEFCEFMKIDKINSVGKNIIIQDFDNDFVFLFKIGGVLKTLPNHSEFIVSPDFFNMFKVNYITTGFIPVGDQTRIDLLSSEPLNKEDMVKHLQPINAIDYELSEIEIVGGETLYSYTIYTSDFISDSVAVNYSSKFKSNTNETKLLKVWNPVMGFSEVEDPHYISFNFDKELEKIRALQVFLKENYKMEIELSVVEDRDNFSMVSKLTYFMILSLIVISLISFSIFLFNMISSHLDKVKANIGTFMAFGFNGKVIEQIYTRSMMKFMAYAWLICAAFLSVFWLIGYLLQIFSLALFHPVVIIIFLLFNAIAHIITKYITTKLLAETPGDLIYNRV